MREMLGITKEAAPEWERLMRTVDAIAKRVGANAGDPLTDALPIGHKETAPR